MNTIPFFAIQEDTGPRNVTNSLLAARKASRKTATKKSSAKKSSRKKH